MSSGLMAKEIRGSQLPQRHSAPHKEPSNEEFSQDPQDNHPQEQCFQQKDF